MVQQIFLFLRRAHHYKIIQGLVQFFPDDSGEWKTPRMIKIVMPPVSHYVFKKERKKSRSANRAKFLCFCLSLRHCLFWLSDKKKIRLHHHNFHIISETHHRSQFSYHLISTQPRVKKYERPSVIVPEAEWSNRLSNQD